MKIQITEQQFTAVEGFRNQWLLWHLLNIRVMVGFLGILSSTVPGARFASAQKLSPTIRVRVNNYTSASPAVLTGAERQATRIFGAAGLRLVWVDCPESHSHDLSQDPCQDALEATDIVLRVVSESARNKFQDTVFGFAVQPVLATVYYEYPVRLAKRDDADFELPVILGSVMAHEIGHLLLGPDSHSNSGIMQPRWEHKQVRQAMTGTLLFTQVQAKNIQAEARARMNSEMISLKSQTAKPVD
ncbi:MAG TPA: hypothetical protein VMI32_18315 [Candidatus Solibacter sp.]|nr:hypothetical protein [Candidatus Solibacter sp.]